MGGRTYLDTVKRYFRFSRQELKALAIVVLVFAFIFSYNEWGYEKFDIFVGLGNFFRAIIIVALGIFIHEAGQRLAALKVGFKTEVKVWWYGIIIALLLAILSNGKLLFFAATGVWIHHLAVHRLGYFRYGPNVQAFGIIALMGPIANILVATLVKFLQVNLHLIPMDSVFAQKFFLFSWLFAVLNLLPIPPLDGSRLLFYSRLTYAFIFGSIAGYLVLYSLGVYSYILALLIGGAVWLLFYVFFESTWWQG
ncbi:M50 family metallopeptidase [Candidatus Woesearchaeota archaeon]|nr:M50 family metallopeptidase [Candidatus Woesearchaeota archaeon]